MRPSIDSPLLLEIQVLGRFTVRLDGQAVDEGRWERRSAKTLVKLLALTPAHSAQRAQVQQALWPELSPAAAANALNKAIHAARRALEPQRPQGAPSRFVLTGGDRVGLAAPGGVRVDADLFERVADEAIRRGDVAAARESLALYVGQLLVDDLYAPWTQARRASLRERMRATAVGTARLLADRGLPLEAVPLVQRALQTDPGDDELQALLVQLHMACGDRVQAWRQLQAAEAALASQGLAPGAALAAWARRLRAPAGDARSSPPVAAAAPAGLGGTASPAPPAFPVLPGTPASASPAAVQAPGSALGWSPRVLPLTDRMGNLASARFAADGASVYLCADWDGQGLAVHHLPIRKAALGPGSGPCDASGMPRAQRVSEPGTLLLSVSASGDLALSRTTELRHRGLFIGELQVRRASGALAPVDLATPVLTAQWHPHADARAADEPLRWLAVVREVDDRCRLEFPVGQVRHVTTGWISSLHFSPDGRHLAFLDHPIPFDDEGDVRVVDLHAEAAPVRILSAAWLSLSGLAWVDGEVWFTGLRQGSRRALFRVDLQGVTHPVHTDSRSLTLHDAGPGRRLLISSTRDLVRTFVHQAGEAVDRDISWHDFSRVRAIDPEGRRLAVEDMVPPGRQAYRAYLRHLDGSAAQPLGEGVPLAWSQDGRTLILRMPAQPNLLKRLDLPTLRSQALPNGGDSPLVPSEVLALTPDGRRLVFWATDAQGRMGVYLQDLDGGDPWPLQTDRPGLRMTSARAVTPDGRQVLLVDAQGQALLVPLDPHVPSTGDEPEVLPGFPANHFVQQWHEDGRDAFIFTPTDRPPRILRYHRDTGTVSDWLRLRPTDFAAGGLVVGPVLTPDGRTCVYTTLCQANDLYLYQDGEG